MNGLKLGGVWLGVIGWWEWKWEWLMLFGSKKEWKWNDYSRLVWYYIMNHYLLALKKPFHPKLRGIKLYSLFFALTYPKKELHLLHSILLMQEHEGTRRLEEQEYIWISSLSSYVDFLLNANFVILPLKTLNLNNKVCHLFLFCCMTIFSVNGGRW